MEICAASFGYSVDRLTVAQTLLWAANPIFYSILDKSN